MAVKTKKREKKGTPATVASVTMNNGIRARYAIERAALMVERGWAKPLTPEDDKVIKAFLREQHEKDKK